MMRAWILVVVALGGGSAVFAQEGGAPPSTGDVAKQPKPADAPTELNSPAPVAQPNPAEVGLTALERLEPEIFGYMKVGYFYVTSPRSASDAGSRSGFRLINARVGASVRPATSVLTVVTLEASAPLRDLGDGLAGTRIVALRDAFIEWRAGRYLRLRAGQFKVPFNAESLFPDATLPFVTRSVVTDGIFPPEGPPRFGLALDRQIGAQASSERLGGAVGFQYAVAVVNGNGPNTLTNDDNGVSPVGRLTLSLHDWLQVGANALYNPTPFGDAPGGVETQLSYGGDVSVNAWGLSLFGMYVTREITRPGPGLPTERADGWVAQLRYDFTAIGFDVGVRYARLEPKRAQEQDWISEATALLGYRPDGLPLRVLAQYTLRTEAPAVAIPNDSVDLLAQVSF